MQHNKVIENTDDQFLPTVEAAKLVGLAEQTLASDRVTRRLGIPFHKFGASVRYRRRDLLDWAASCRQGTAHA